MEVQSTGNLQVLLLAGGKEKMLDDEQIAVTAIAAPGGMPVLRPGAINDR